MVGHVIVGEMQDSSKTRSIVIAQNEQQCEIQLCLMYVVMCSK